MISLRNNILHFLRKKIASKMCIRRENFIFARSMNKKTMQDPKEYIEVYGARVHNLKNIDVRIPRDSLTVITGLSGSGKSSLAFDTLFAEGQRRYIETFSAYARNFLGNLERPDVDKITGLSPVISIEQKTTNKNPRSTVGTTPRSLASPRLTPPHLTSIRPSPGPSLVLFPDRRCCRSRKYGSSPDQNRESHRFVSFHCRSRRHCKRYGSHNLSPRTRQSNRG